MNLQIKKLDKKKIYSSYSKLSEIKLISIGLASDQIIKQWAEKTLPNGKILGQVTSANTLHHKTFKPLKGGLFCERIFGPLKDFQCACEKKQRPNETEYKKILQHQQRERKFCPECDVEYTWSIIRRYQMGYIELVSPVSHIWYLKANPSYLSIILDMKRQSLENIIYCSEILTLENAWKSKFSSEKQMNPSHLFLRWQQLLKINKKKDQKLSAKKKKNKRKKLKSEFMTSFNHLRFNKINKIKMRILNVDIKKRKKLFEILFEKFWQYFYIISYKLAQKKSVKLLHQIYTKIISKLNVNKNKYNSFNKEFFQQNFQQIFEKDKSDIGNISLNSIISFFNDLEFFLNYDFESFTSISKIKEIKFLEKFFNSKLVSKIIEFKNQNYSQNLIPFFLINSKMIFLEVESVRKNFSVTKKEKQSQFYNKKFYTFINLLKLSIRQYILSLDYKKIVNSLNKAKISQDYSIWIDLILIKFVKKTFFFSKILSNQISKITLKYKIEEMLKSFSFLNDQFLENYNPNELDIKLTSAKISIKLKKIFKLIDKNFKGKTLFSSLYQEKFKKFVQYYYAFNLDKNFFKTHKLSFTFFSPIALILSPVTSPEVIGDKKKVTGEKIHGVKKQVNRTLINQVKQSFFLQSEGSAYPNKQLKSFILQNRIFNNHFVKTNKQSIENLKFIYKKNIFLNFNRFNQLSLCYHFFKSIHLEEKLKQIKFFFHFSFVFPPIFNLEVTSFLSPITSGEVTGEKIHNGKNKERNRKKSQKNPDQFQLSSKFSLLKQNKKFVLINFRKAIFFSIKKGEVIKNLINNIYSLSHRHGWKNDKNWQYFAYYTFPNYDFDDLIIPLYKNNYFNSLNFSTEDTVVGAGIIQKLLSELNLNELRKMDKQNRILLYELNRKINKLKNYFKNDLAELPEKKQLKEFCEYRDQLIRKTKLIRKIFRKNSNIEAMILTILPVLPPDLRPILKMQNQIAASDLNRLYQRVIYRNERFKKFLKDPAISNSFEVKYSQRLLQEAVDNLIQNGKSGGKAQAERDSRGRLLKSLSEVLKGKQGRFRQYLLGKRVDYSGRSVIVVGPKLKLHECGLPKEMALELFLPFLIKRILHYNYARTVIGAKTILKNNKILTFKVLEEIMQNHPILLNRAPTLHRLGFQAFQPKLVEGRAILLHPLVCPPFNADFDGDQMAVHIPLIVEARAEAWKLMVSRNNLISSSTGDPVILPSQDMVLGCYYLTTEIVKSKTSFIKIENEIMSNSFGLKSSLKQSSVFHKFSSLNQQKYFSNLEQVIKAYQLQKLNLHENLWIKWNFFVENYHEISDPYEIRIHLYGSYEEIRSRYYRHFDLKGLRINQLIKTTAGRILFNTLINNCKVNKEFLN